MPFVNISTNYIHSKNRIFTGMVAIVMVVVMSSRHHLFLRTEFSCLRAISSVLSVTMYTKLEPHVCLMPVKWANSWVHFWAPYYPNDWEKRSKKSNNSYALSQSHEIYFRVSKVSSISLISIAFERQTTDNTRKGLHISSTFTVARVLPKPNKHMPSP